MFGRGLSPLHFSLGCGSILGLVIFYGWVGFFHFSIGVWGWVIGWGLGFSIWSGSCVLVGCFGFCVLLGCSCFCGLRGWLGSYTLVDFFGVFGCGFFLSGGFCFLVGFCFLLPLSSLMGSGVWVGF